MENVDRAALHQACRTLVKPIASLLMKCGMTWREFADMSKEVFVEVAGAEFGIRGRATNISRVALLTGISRKEVKRQRELLAIPKTHQEGKTTDATRVLSGWYQDPDFLDDEGQPQCLPVEGTGASFTGLCRRYAGDIPATTMKKELKRVGAIAENSDGLVTAKGRYYMPIPFDSQWLLNAGTVFADLGNNISHNLVADDEHPSRFLGRASDYAIDKAAIPEFHRFVEQQAEPFLELVDDWLSRHRVSAESGNDHQVRLGLGVFMIQGDQK